VWLCLFSRSKDKEKRKVELENPRQKETRKERKCTNVKFLGVEEREIRIDESSRYKSAHAKKK